MRTVVFGFSKPKQWKPFAEIIKFVDNSYFSHSYIKFRSHSLDRTLIYQASGTKVNFIGEELFTKDNDVVAEYIFQVTDDEYKKILQWCVDNCGVKYSLKVAIGLSIYRVLKKKTSLLKGAGFVCSVLAAKLLDEFVDEGVDPEIMTPKLLFLYFEAHHSHRRIK